MKAEDYPMATPEEREKSLKEIQKDKECQDCGGSGWNESHTGLSVQGAKCYTCSNTGEDARVVFLLAEGERLLADLVGARCALRRAERD